MLGIKTTESRPNLSIVKLFTFIFYFRMLKVLYKTLELEILESAIEEPVVEEPSEPAA